MPWIGRMMVVSLVGFVISSAFVTVEGFELPFYVALIGACGLKVSELEAAREGEIVLSEEHAIRSRAHWGPSWAGLH
jgi:hypothetical protein